jgi:hypothetical protein
MVSQISRRRVRRRMISAWILGVAAVAFGAGCGTPRQSPSPTVLREDGIAVGSEVACATPTMQRMCDLWVTAALGQANVSAAEISSSAVHVAWSTVPRTMGVNVVVVFGLRNGSTLYEPIFCGVSTVPNPACDFSGVSLPPN